MGVHWTLISDHQISNHHCTFSHVEIRIYQSGDPFRVIASQNVTLLRIRVYVQLERRESCSGSDWGLTSEPVVLWFSQLV